MAASAFTSIVQNLPRAIVTSLTGVGIEGRGLERLRYEVGLIKAFLADAERRQAEGERIRIFARNLVDLAYRIEDLIENIIIELEYRKLKFFRRLVHTPPPGAREIAEEIREITNRIEYFTRIARLIGVSGEGSSDAANWSAALSRQTYGHQMEEHFVGRMEEMKLLHCYIKDPEYRVIAICGMGGSGKTALAKKLYQDLQDKNHFYPVAWVYVSHDVQRRRILEDLYVQLWPYGEEELVSEMESEVLVQRVCEILQHNKCLVVLDEIWSPELVERRSPDLTFLFRKTASKILITTRVAGVAAELGAEKIHRLRYLSQHESYLLFSERVRRMDLPEVEANKKLELGKEAVKFCGGLPSAVLNFQFIATKHTLEELMAVHQNLESYVRKSQEIGGTTSTLHLLSLSYYDLPQRLGKCFLYLGNFREHALIDAEKLYLLWVAEGLISLQDCRSGETLKDVAEMFLSDLEQRSMIELHEEEVPIVIRFKSCQLNPMMRHFSLLKSKEQGFFKVEDFGRGLIPDSTSRNDAYRLAVNFDKYEDGCDFLLEDNEKKHMRCLLFSVKENQQAFVWPRKLSNLVVFKYLRSLDFDGFDFQVIKQPRCIGKLVHLTYLSFRNCILPKLPSSVCNLTRLLILDLRVRPLSKITIPNILWKLEKLMHLYFPESFDTCDAGKLRLEGLTELETLINFNTGMLNFEDLLQLSKLRYVSSKIAGSSKEIELITSRMNITSNGNSLCTSLEIRNFDCYAEENHSRLRSILECRSLTVFCVEGHICHLPVHSKISQNLAKIVLIGSQLRQDPMKTLEHLPKLRVLILNDDAVVENKMICSAAGFIELERLELRNLQNFGEWIVEDQAMPKLSTLAIVNCRKLKMLPGELQFVRRLQQMNIRHVHEELEKSLKMVEEQMRMDNVQPLPKIMFEQPSNG
ncbi:putative disease resistance protein [Sesamum alatum]|uniref:Disease resistance protein n=1 Tax=Sesamum alatum TaxID=300844 RepID=A0AAE1Y887_9LAMI|nr:putative disease resistance protein [Sesamum alatum]